MKGRRVKGYSILLTLGTCLALVPMASKAHPGDISSPMPFSDDRMVHGKQRGVRISNSGIDLCGERRNLVNGRIANFTWYVVPDSEIAGADSTMLAGELRQALPRWSVACESCFESADVLGSPSSTDSTHRDFVNVVWERRERIETAGNTDLLARFDPELDSNCHIIGGTVLIAIDPVLPRDEDDSRSDSKHVHWATHEEAHMRIPRPDSPDGIEMTRSPDAVCLTDMAVHEFGHTLGLDNLECPPYGFVMCGTLPNDPKDFVPHWKEIAFLRRMYHLPSR